MQEVEFLYRTTRSIEMAVEDDIRINLEAMGFNVINRGVAHDVWNTMGNVSELACGTQHRNCRQAD
jgi:hypothetical protein